MNATVQADFGASWYAGTAAGAFERPRLTFDIDVDVCVIGGGLAGLTAAREVARRGWSVAGLEAERERGGPPGAAARRPAGGPAGAGGRRCRGRSGSRGARPAAAAASSCRDLAPTPA